MNDREHEGGCRDRAERRQTSFVDEGEDQREEGGDEEQPRRAARLGEELQPPHAVPGEDDEGELAEGGRHAACPRAKERRARTVREQDRQRRQDCRQEENYESWIDAGETRGQRKGAVPERERISGTDPGVRKVVHDSDRSKGTRFVELSHSGEVEEGVADGRPEAASDRAGDPPEDARERRPTGE